jgi:hypothetical protein|tara:strand:+ start:165 stop:362 length:198 start_codon:yes stop_codon:yes gene_type:complete
MTKKPTDWMQYSGVGIQMAATMMMGLWIGGKVENYFSFSESYGQLFGLFFGVFAAMYNLIKSVNR